MTTTIINLTLIRYEISLIKLSMQTNFKDCDSDSTKQERYGLIFHTLIKIMIEASEMT